MKQYIFKILIFITIITALDICSGFIGDYLQSHAKGGLIRNTNDFIMNDVHDVIIFGSSRAHHHYDAPFLCDTLGIDVYNAGYDGNGAVLSYGLLSMVLKRYQPRLIVYDLEPAFDIYKNDNDNGNIRYLSQLKPYYGNSAISDIIKDVSYEEWFKVRSGMLRYNSKFISMLIDNIKGEKDIKKGYEPLNGIYDNQPDNCNIYPEEMDDLKLKYLEKLILLAKSYNVPIVMVASPKYGKKISDELNVAKEICKKNNIYFLDYYADNSFMKHSNLFKDYMHLNSYGAKIFSGKIAKDIKKILN